MILTGKYKVTMTNRKGMYGMIFCAKCKEQFIGREGFLIFRPTGFPNEHGMKKTYAFHEKCDPREGSNNV